MKPPFSPLNPDDKTVFHIAYSGLMLDIPSEKALQSNRSGGVLIPGIARTEPGDPRSGALFQAPEYDPATSGFL
jgi:hypothetical protein